MARHQYLVHCVPHQSRSILVPYPRINDNSKNLSCNWDDGATFRVALIHSLTNSVINMSPNDLFGSVNCFSLTIPMFVNGPLMKDTSQGYGTVIVHISGVSVGPRQVWNNLWMYSVQVAC